MGSDQTCHMDLEFAEHRFARPQKTHFLSLFAFIRVNSRLTGFVNLQPWCENGVRSETDIMTQNQTLFFHKFGITPNDLERYLAEALSAGGDFADLYFEYSTTTSITLDESMVKSASQGISAGCGVRVLSGERTGYAHTDDLAPEKIVRAARTAALIARGPALQTVQSFGESKGHQLYQVSSPSVDAEIAAKLALVQRADQAARAFDPRIVQVRASYADELRQIMLVGADGTSGSDVERLARCSGTCCPKSGANSSRCAADT